MITDTTIIRMITVTIMDTPPAITITTIAHIISPRMDRITIRMAIITAAGVMTSETVITGNAGKDRMGKGKEKDLPNNPVSSELRLKIVKII